MVLMKIITHTHSSNDEVDIYIDYFIDDQTEGQKD